ncbi:MAG: AmmeMemoRadiSam system radical SAM enzyme [Spirochaetota bacterium]
MKEAMLYRRLEGGAVRCSLCAHRCRIPEDGWGLCGVRCNREGRLYTAVYGRLIASHVDPIEKKPLYHFLPGTLTYSIATMGCNFRCGFCQNWQISQAVGKEEEIAGVREVSPGEVVRAAKQASCQSIAYTYTEPTIFFEYAYDTARRAREEELKNLFVTNGYLTAEAMDLIRPCLDAANVDLKSFRDEYYRRVCGARLRPVLGTIRRMKEAGIWVEITTLVVPGENDSREELGDIARFIAGLDRGIPWHVSRFFPLYRYDDASPTPLRTMRMAEEIGREAGLEHVHLGNV